MRFITIKTRKILPPKDGLEKIFKQYLPRLHDGDVVFVTSKIVAISQGRCVKIHAELDKDLLITKEAEKIIPRSQVPKQFSILTVKGHTLIPSAGIDESNANGYFILWPEKPEQTARKIWTFLKKLYKLTRLGVVITDSRTYPMRRGTVGTAIGYFGFEPIKDYRGTPDIFGRKLKITRSNLVDPLAAMAVLLMGEGREQTPIVILRGAKFLKFTNRQTFSEFIIPEKEDLYYPLLKVFRKPN